MKRYQYWGSENGQPKILWTDWYEWDSDYQPKFQLGRKLLNDFS